MLLEFTVGNYRSFNKKCTLSLCAQGISDEPKNECSKKRKCKDFKNGGYLRG